MRVRQFLPFLDDAGISHQTMSYYSPSADRLVADVRAGQWSPWLRPLLLGGATVFQLCFKWFTRVRVLLAAPRVEIVFLQGVLPPVWYVKVLKVLNARVVLDMDDAIFLGNPQRGAAVVPLMWQVIAGSHYIFEYARALGARVALVPSAVSLDRYDAATDGDGGTHRPIRVGWLGSQSTVQYLEQLVEPLRNLAAQGHEIELMLAGVASNADVLAKFSGITVSCTPSYRDEEIPSIVSRYDIGVMPLSDGPWERAKCAMKALIYMAGGKPTVCSRVGENTYVIADASNGFLAESPGQWTKALGALMSDAALRAKIGRRGRDTVEARYSSRVCFGLLMEHVFSRAGATLGPAETVN